MAEHKTRLAYLLARIGLRPIDLSRGTGIDKTVVSRWQSGKRRFTPTGNMATLVTGCILNQPGAGPVVERVLLVGGYDTDPPSLAQNLALWLSEEPLEPLLRDHNAGSETQYTSLFTVFLGYKGLRRAATALTEFAIAHQSLSGTTEVLVAFWGTNKWFSGNPKFNRDLYNILDTSLRNNLRFTIAHPDTFEPRDIAALAGNWLAANMKGTVRSLDLPEAAIRPVEKEEDHLYVAAHGCVSLEMFSNAQVTDGIYSKMYTDVVSNADVYQLCKGYVEQSVPRYRFGFFAKPGETLSRINKEKQLASNWYLCVPAPTLGTIMHDALHLHTRLPKKQIVAKVAALAPLLYNPAEYMARANIYHIYCADYIEAVFCRPRYRDETISAIFGTSVNYSRKLLQQQLCHILHWMQTIQQYHVAFLPAQEFEKLPLSYSVVENNFFVAWLKDGTESTSSSRENRVGALSLYARQVWEGLPAIYKDKDATIVKLQHWLDEYGEANK